MQWVLVLRYLSVHSQYSPELLSTKEKVLVITADCEVCGLSRLTRTLFVDRDIADFSKCDFFFFNLSTQKNHSLPLY